MAKFDIDKIINEELGIADGVLKMVRTIENLVDNSEESQWRKVIQTDKGEVTIDFVRIFTKTIEELQEWFQSSHRIDGYSFKENTIYLTQYYVEGYNLGLDFYDTIQHECEHFWQSNNAKKCLSNERYEKITFGIYDANPVYSHICKILYSCYRVEIDAFVNGAYSTAIKSKNIKTYTDFIKHNKSLFDSYMNLKNAETYFDNCNRAYLMIAIFKLKSCRIFPQEWNEEKITNYIKASASKSFKYFVKKAGRAYSLIIKKREEEELNKIKAKIEKSKNWN